MKRFNTLFYECLVKKILIQEYKNVTKRFLWNFQPLPLNVAANEIRLLRIFRFLLRSHESCHHLLITIIFTDSMSYTGLTKYYKSV